MVHLIYADNIDINPPSTKSSSRYSRELATNKCSTATGRIYSSFSGKKGEDREIKLFNSGHVPSI